MDLFTTGPSLNYLSSSSPMLKDKERSGSNNNDDANIISKNDGGDVYSGHINVNNNNGTNSNKLGAPKYSFDRNTSFKSVKNATSLSHGNGYMLIAIIEGKGSDRCHIGMASMDIRSSELTLCQFVDTSSYSLLKICLSLSEPIEIIMPEDRDKTPSRAIMDLFGNICPKTNVTPVLRRYFNDATGIDLIKKLHVEECSNLDASVYQKYYCMSACAALIKYIEYIQNILFAQNSLKITYVAVEDSCMIDVNSWKSLDLIHMDIKPKKGDPNSLFEILNCCVTPGGMKTLRSYLLQPSANITIINERLDIVQELVTNQAMCNRIRGILSTLSDLQQLIAMCTYINVGQEVTREDSKRTMRFKITQAVALKTLLGAIKQLSTIIAQSKVLFFMQSKSKLDDDRLDSICELVDEKIASEKKDNSTRKRKVTAASSRDMVLFAIAEKQHVLLDLARRTYQELVTRIIEFGKQVQKEISGAQLNYSQTRGYHFSLHANDPYNIRLPPHCIQIVYNKTSLTFTNRELIKYNDRLFQSENEILQKGNLLLNQLIGSIRKFIPALYNCAELISLLDYFTALACYSSRVNTVRPSFGTKINIQNGRHPILDYRKDVIPNDTNAAYDESRFAIIAGPNMAGKSTYMRQVCLIQILAQIGCMVPADSATFIPLTRIFSRVGHNDDLVRNLSGFSVEMSEMAIILQNANSHTLIIIDELARSTSTEEGIGICYAICERLIATGAFVFFATHFLDMAQLEINYPQIVKNYHFTSLTTTGSDGIEVLAPTHQLQEGAYKGPLYGLDLAALSTLPQKILIETREIAESLRRNKEIVRENLSISRQDKEKTNAADSNDVQTCAFISKTVEIVEIEYIGTFKKE